MERKIGEIPAMLAGAGMMGSRYCWDAQFRRYQQIDALEKQGHTHIRIGETVSLIGTAKRRAEQKSGGVCGLEKRIAKHGKGS